MMMMFDKNETSYSVVVNNQCIEMVVNIEFSIDSKKKKIFQSKNFYLNLFSE